MKKTLFIFILPLLLVLSLACQFSTNLPDISATFAAPTENSVPVSTGISPKVTLVPTSMLPTLQPTPLLAIVNDQSGLDVRLSALYDRVSPGVVAIQVTTQQGAGLGSGFVYDQQGDIVTNYHVVESAQNMEVDFPSGLKVQGKVLGTDLDSDLAVVKVDVPSGQLVPLIMGDSDQVKVGQGVVAIGNPFGYYGTMTYGIVSAKGRTLDSIRQSPDGGSFEAGDIIQTDAAINPGNSGGPLLNLNGEVIGMNRAIQTTGLTASGEPTNSGIGFAVSANIIKRVVPSLIKNGTFDYPYLGISALPQVSLADQEVLGLDRSTGAYISEVVPGGPADKAGLKGGSRATNVTNLEAGGDLIIAVDGHPVQVFGDVLSYLMTSKSPGDQVTFSILRNNVQKEVVVTLDKRP
jgi:S1-C subfamily serine protease